MSKISNRPEFQKLEDLINLNVPSLNASNKAALAGSLVTLTIIVISALIVGSAFPEPLNLIQSTYPTTRFLSSAVIAATATILALMLTILGISQNNNKISPTVYVRISKLTFVDTITFIAAVIFLALHNLPINETEMILSNDSLIKAYYAMLGFAGLLSGALVYIAIMLYFTVKDLILSRVESEQVK